MSEFLVSVAKTLVSEGGFALDRSTGECVNFGITAWFLRSIGVLHGQGPASADEISRVQSMTREYAISLYRKYFWDAHRIGEIADQALADKVFDLTVNMGAGGITKKGIIWGGITLLQFAVNTTVLVPGKTEMAPLKVDGIVGNKTLLAINALDSVDLLETYRRLAEARYREIAQAPKQAPKLAGWLARLAA